MSRSIDESAPSAADQRRSEREQREDLELAAAIVAAWMSRFGRVAVVVEPTLAAIRRGHK